MKIGKLQLWEKKGFRILLLLEAILFIVAVIGLFGQEKSFEYGVEEGVINFGSYQEETASYYVDASVGRSGYMIDFKNIALSKGCYIVTLYYNTDTDFKNICTVTDNSVGYKGLLANGEHLYAGRNSTEFEIWLLRDTEQLEVHAEYAGEGSLAINGLKIIKTNAMNRIFLFWVILGIIVINAIYICRQYDRMFGISSQNKKVAFGLGICILLASVPLMVDYMPQSSDLIFHLNRIEGIKDGLLRGQFPVRIAPEWQQGYGYASSIFYGETLLYLAALLRMIGFTVVTSYRLFFFIITVITVLVSYYCFKNIFDEKYIGLICSGIYVLSIYRIYRTYIRGYMGETMAFVFMPLLVYGFYRVFATDISDKKYSKSWIPLTIGFTGLIQSHVLSCEMVGGFTVLLCIIFWKRVFRKQTFLCLAKTVICSCLLSAWFLVPFLDYMLTGNFVIHNVSGRTIQEMGLQLSQLFTLFPKNGSNLFFGNNGVVDSHPVAPGIILILSLGLWLYLLFLGKTEKLKTEYRMLGNVAALFGGLALWMSLSVFPWNSIHSLHGITAKLVSSLQYPNRLISIATITLTVLAGVCAKYIWENEKETFKIVYCVIVCVVTLSSSMYLMDDMLNTMVPIKVYNAEGMGTGYISGGEYNPYGSDPALFVTFVPKGDSNLEIFAYEKKGLDITMYCKNSSDANIMVELPLVFYKGYVAQGNNDCKIQVGTGDNFRVAVDVPAGYEGEIQVSFRSPWYWRSAEIISLITILALILKKVLTKLVGENKIRLKAPRRRIQ